MPNKSSFLRTVIHPNFKILASLCSWESLFESNLVIFEPWHEISNTVVCVTSKGSDQPAHQSLCESLQYSMSVKLLTEHHLEFLSLKGGCTCSSVSTLVKMPHCWKSHIAAQFLTLQNNFYKKAHLSNLWVLSLLCLEWLENRLKRGLLDWEPALLRLDWELVVRLLSKSLSLLCLDRQLEDCLSFIAFKYIFIIHNI